MNKDFYKKLVDMYAGCELPEELEQEMEWASFGDQELSHDMATMRKTVELLHAMPKPEFTEESNQRILMKLYSKGADVNPKQPTVIYLQYQLPIQS